MARETFGRLRLIDLQDAKARRAAADPAEATPTPALHPDDRTHVGAPARPPERGVAAGLLLVDAPDPAALGQFFALEGDELVVGRGRDAGVVVDDPGVSRQHAKLVRRPSGAVVLQDLGSTNGTYVNGVAVRSARLVKGDRVQIGTGTEFIYGVRREAAAEEIRLRQAIAASGAGAFEWTAATGALQLSGAIASGLSGEGEAAEADGWRHVLPADRPLLAERLQRALSEGGRFEAECRVALAGEAIGWIALGGTAFRDEAGKPVRITGAALDVTERKRAEIELRRQALLFDALSDAVLAVGSDGAIVAWNGGAERLFGWSRAEALGRRPGALLHPDQEDRLTERLVNCARSGERYTEELTLRKRGGGDACAEVVAVPLQSPELGVVATVAVFRDVGERKRLHERLRLTERLAALGTLAAGVAHEINNPLTFVVANLEYVSGKLANRSSLTEAVRNDIDAALADCLKGAHRIRTIVQDMRGCVGDRQGPPSRVDLTAPLEFALRMADRKIRLRARLRKEIGEVPQVLVDEGRLGQVLLNLLVNAAEAIAPEHPEQNEVAVVTRYDADAGRVVVEISDSGPGIPLADQPRIFDPFFTTKPVGSGVGLGLFVCHGIITGMGGEMGFRSTPGEGTTFWVSLPAAAPRRTPSRARVLVVDDEADVGVALKRCFEGVYDVTSVADGREALRRIAAGERYTLVLADVEMPDLGGPELLARIAEVDPAQAARAVLITGGCTEEGPCRRGDDPRVPVLAKPFDLALLRDLVDLAAATTPAAPAA